MSRRGWSGPKVSRLRTLVLDTYGTTCHLCGGPGADTADHIIPGSCGGDDSLDNLRPAHFSCNSARGNMPLAQWFTKHKQRTNPVEPSRNW